jgi:hypothetical protein
LAQLELREKERKENRRKEKEKRKRGERFSVFILDLFFGIAGICDCGRASRRDLS